MRVVLDTNVIIAAFATQGICHALLEVCIDQHHVVLSDFILAEVEANLGKKLKIPDSVVRSIIDFLRERAELVDHGGSRRRVSRDPKDDWVLQLAVVAKADYLITGDDDLLILKSHDGVPIVTPRQFWEALREEGQNAGLP